MLTPLILKFDVTCQRMILDLSRASSWRTFKAIQLINLRAVVERALVVVLLRKTKPSCGATRPQERAAQEKNRLGRTFTIG